MSSPTFKTSASPIPIRRKLSPEEVSYHYTRYLCSPENCSDTFSDSDATVTMQGDEYEGSRASSGLSCPLIRDVDPNYNLQAYFDHPFKEAQFDEFHPLTYARLDEFCSLCSHERSGELKQQWDAAFTDLSHQPQLQEERCDDRLDLTSHSPYSGLQFEQTEETIIEPSLVLDDEDVLVEHDLVGS